MLFAQPDANAGQRLQLMTIHKAKGLEFDTVILPGLGRCREKTTAAADCGLNNGASCCWRRFRNQAGDADPIYKYLERLERRKTEHETARLLYVAATRARSRLHLLGSVKTKDDGSVAEPASGSFLKLLWPAVSDSVRGHFAAPSPRENRRSMRKRSAVFPPIGELPRRRRR